MREPHPETGKPTLFATPLFFALIMVEAADIIFAVDSVPAIFTVKRDPFIVYTSNIFAILGLRSMYFMLAAAVRRFAYPKYGLSAVLVLIGFKSSGTSDFRRNCISSRISSRNGRSSLH